MKCSYCGRPRQRLIDQCKGCGAFDVEPGGVDTSELLARIENIRDRILFDTRHLAIRNVQWERPAKNSRYSMYFS